MARSSTKIWSRTTFAVLAIFLTAFLLFGFSNKPFTGLSILKSKKRFKFPDFDNIILSKTLIESDVNLESNRRLILIGDTHGMNHSLHDLLRKLSYDQTDDVLLFVGDLLTKSTHSGSLSMLDFLTENHMSHDNSTERIFAVRGNHDQLVVQWRAWREWFESLELPIPSGQYDSSTMDPPLTSGRDFLHVVEAEWAVERAKREADAEEWVDVARKRAEDTWREEWWSRIPPPGKGKHKQEWKMFGDHYWLARDMTRKHAVYLKSLPLILHAPSHHFFVVHAGLLPSDPRISPRHPRQPLSHHPRHKKVASSDYEEGQDGGFADRIDRLRFNLMSEEQSTLPNTLRRGRMSEEELRIMQEEALLRQIPQNRKWWDLLNMRSVRKSGKVTRKGRKGTPWSDIWNDQMNRCAGYGKSFTVTDEVEDAGYSLPCRPSTVIYGHSASKGLDIKRWSKGLDTGCLYGRKLTALVLSRKSTSPFESGDEVEVESMKFGDGDSDIRAELVNVRCVPVG